MIFIFFVGVVVLALMFLIRVDIDTKAGGRSRVMRMVEATSPVFIGPVRAALDSGKEGPTTENKEYFYHQGHPKELLGRLFG